MKDWDVIIAGGGAAGFFAAVHLGATLKGRRIAILERSAEVLSKVRISGGGRCNVTHAEFVPRELTAYYPRGGKELLGPFHSFCSGDTAAFFEARGVSLKTEEDGRMFPVTDTSQTIVDCLTGEASRYGVKVLTGYTIRDILKTEGGFSVRTKQGDFHCGKLLVATGSSPAVWRILGQLGHRIVPPVPSLFTFHVGDTRISGLMGLSATVSLRCGKMDKNMVFEGPLLITHWGVSGPAVLKCSAWGARYFHHCDYKFEIEINWLPQMSFEEALEQLTAWKQAYGRKEVRNASPFSLPRRLWERLVAAAGVVAGTKWAEAGNVMLRNLAFQLTKGVFQVSGKSTFKEEFVTAGGVDLKEIDFKRFESKVQQGLFLAGEVLDIDAVTGGFNFQNAWTGGYMASRAIAEELSDPPD
ncbi:BaiN/RdsA family NAD(P)/FAD-dependent oxidoreductase [Sinomicrobium soli]|uniref:NAD(P)/FAD-dependent oxidoreductase n=1 Tax=Sinomicrobium sp. N-1-3-6 TaxID=2219864 RepID=UPI000DCDEE28|nr:NAD(P)/FAD-dependent oxidoreductase [Sinomicrobium sp. N-1-3-6]RAV29492.1 aminoacetone oxidase family FAD-binding enzyme [Sinomicrobium sp. N-1-3-6]